MDKESFIVDMIGYNEHGHIVYTKPGNGTETTYAYDRERQWLQEMNLMAGGNAVMHNKYCFDAVDNIPGISNAAARKFAKKYGGTVEKWEGQNGMMYASVTTRSYNATEATNGIDAGITTMGEVQTIIDAVQTQNQEQQ